MEEETVLADGHYYVPMLWKDEVNLSDNYVVANIGLPKEDRLLEI